MLNIDDLHQNNDNQMFGAQWEIEIISISKILDVCDFWEDIQGMTRNNCVNPEMHSLGKAKMAMELHCHHKPSWCVCMWAGEMTTT